jgi:hypothetical protein
MDQIRTSFCVIVGLALLALAGIAILFLKPSNPPATAVVSSELPSVRSLPQAARPASQSVIKGSHARGSMDASLGSLGHKVQPTPPISARDELLELIRITKENASTGLDQVVQAFQLKAKELTASERNEVVARIAELAARGDLNQGRIFLEELSDFRDRHNFVKGVIEAISGDRLAEAGDWATQLPDPQLVKAAHNAIGMKWGQSDVNAALMWAQSVSDAESRLSALEGLTWAWGQKDPNAAYEWAAQLPEPAVRDKVFVKLSKMISTQNPQRGAEWALQFPAGAGRSEALDYAVFQWASKDLQAAANWANQIPQPRLREDSLVAVARSWSNTDPQGATAWADQIPEPSARTAALITTARKWAENQPEQAANWMNQLAPDSAREEVFRNITSALFAARPATAETWLNGLLDPSLRRIGEQILALERQRLSAQAARTGQP